MPERLPLNVNGQTHVIEVDDPNMPLLYALRDDLALSNPRFGCGLGQCGACTVHIDGVAARSCQVPVSAVTAAKITTLAGLGTPEKPHVLQTAWLERTGLPMRLLHQWLDHDGGGFAQRESAPER